MIGRIVGRGGLAAALACLAVAAPAAAQSSDGPESCERDDAFCIGAEKLGERASAECRRVADTSGAPVTDPQCHSQVGRRVDRSLIAAHLASWTHRALAFQYELGADLPLRNAPWIGTHNSYNSTSEFPTLSHTDSNQQLSLVDQLDLDVRSLEIDVHWSPTPRAGADGMETQGRGPVVCHAQEQPEGRPDGQRVHIGCTSERLLGEVLADVAGWLRRPENRREVLLLYLEDHVENQHGAVRAVLEETFGALVYPTGASGPGCAVLPLELTRRQVLAAGAQVVIVGKCGAGWSSHVFDWPEGAQGVRVEERPRGYTLEHEDESKNCGGIPRTTYDAKLVRFYEDSTFLAPAGENMGITSTDQGIDDDVARTMVRCGVDLFGLDQLLPGDRRLGALVWTWAGDKPNPADGACALQQPDSRWKTGACAQPRPAACRMPGGTWRVSPAAVPFDGAPAACQAIGGSFDLPRTGYENDQLHRAGTGAEVWIAHRAFPDPPGGGPAGPGAAPAPIGGVSNAGPSAASAARSRATAICRPGPRTRRGGSRRARSVVCRVRVRPGAATHVTARLTRGRRTYGRTTRRLGPRGGTVVLRAARGLPAGAYAVTLRVTGGARAALTRRVRVR